MSNEKVTRRLQVNLQHIINVNEYQKSSIVPQECSNERERETLNVEKLADFIRGDYPEEDRKLVFSTFEKDVILAKHYYNLKKEEARDIVDEKLRRVLETRLFDIDLLKKDPYTLLQRIPLLNILVEGSVGVKYGVQCILFGGSIINLGNKSHQEKYLEDIMTLRLPGCFAMTELEHGSNVKKLQTTAIYDVETEQFIINTPNKGATKWWLGNAAKNGIMATVFARLIVNGVDHGIHPILVPIRDPKTRQPLNGITIGDCGDKIGLHGVDNGWIQFHNVRVPRENLLNRYGDVSKDGTYTSQFKNEGRRFAAVLGELITGRVSIVASSLVTRQFATTIVVRYATSRKQFGPPNSPEIKIIDYKSYQTKLMPILASCYAYVGIKEKLLKMYSQFHLSQYRDEDLVAELHAIASGLKAVVTWDTQVHLQSLRELCGGHGYSAYNRLGDFRNDHDVTQTFEGDNTVLIQQTSYYLIKEFQNQFKGNQFRDMLRYVQQQVARNVQNRNPFIKRFHTKKHLRSTEFQLNAFKYRTAKLLEAAAMELRANKKKGAFNSWNDCLPKLIPLGRAYIEQITLEEFVKKIDEVEDIQLQHVLKSLCDLFALSIINSDIGNFIDVLHKSKIRAIQSFIVELCSEIRTHALSLVNAFDIPDWCIDAPIAFKQGDYVDHIFQYAKNSVQDARQYTSESESLISEENEVIERV